MHVRSRATNLPSVPDRRFRSPLGIECHTVAPTMWCGVTRRGIGPRWTGVTRLDVASESGRPRVLVRRRAVVTRGTCQYVVWFDSLARLPSSGSVRVSRIAFERPRLLGEVLRFDERPDLGSLGGDAVDASLPALLGNE